MEHAAYTQLPVGTRTPVLTLIVDTRAHTHAHGAHTLLFHRPSSCFVYFWPSITVTGITSCRFVFLLRHYWSSGEGRNMDC